MARKSGVGVGQQLNYLYATLTQGGADAFIQASIATPLTAASEDICLLIREILIEFPGWNPVSAGAFEFALTRKSQTQIPLLTSTYLSLIAKVQRRVGVTTSGGIVWDSLIRLDYDSDNAPRIVESTLYAQFDSNATGASNVAYCRLGYTVEPINAADRNSILVATATAAS